MFGSMRVKMQSLSAQMNGTAKEVGLVPQLSEVDLNKLAFEGVGKRVSPGMVRRRKLNASFG